MSIEVNSLTHIYSSGTPYRSVALSDVSFTLQDREIVGIIGRTGSGKSTLLQHLNGLLKATSGTVKVGDTEITAPKTPLREIRQRVGLVFQYPEYQLFEETVAKDVAFGPMNLGLSKEETDRRVREALALVGLDYDEFAMRSPFELSGGQKRRVAIAGVVAMKPQVLILDEPTAGLDPKARADVIEMVRRIHESEGNTTIFVSHNMMDIAVLSDTVMVMHDGKLVRKGTPKEVFSAAEELEEMGLALPPATAFLQKLRKEGFLEELSVAFTPEAAAGEVLRQLQREK
ncbi:MAG: energy-coupling factor transporter ATPase [Clostridia bacterium]|nr:energy-coupling factor transporter ATPase [Clostridia bacterium]